MKEIKKKLMKENKKEEYESPTISLNKLNGSGIIMTSNDPNSDSDPKIYYF